MLFFYNAGSRLSSRTVSSPVLSAAYVLTVVFGMGTGVAHKRITAGNFQLYVTRPLRASHSRGLRNPFAFPRFALHAHVFLSSYAVSALPAQVRQF